MKRERERKRRKSEQQLNRSAKYEKAAKKLST
jgi:hypothetical protein